MISWDGIPHYKDPEWPVWLIDTHQRWLLAAAYSYNTEEIPLASDLIYDASVKMLERLRDKYPDEWAQSEVHPEVFLEDEQAWTYTSFHFPKSEDVAAYLYGQRSRM